MRGKKSKKLSRRYEAWRQLFCDRARQVRREAGLTQKQLAERVGLNSANAVSHFESGGSDHVRLDLIEALFELAAEQGIARDWVLGVDPQAARELVAPATMGDAVGAQVMAIVRQLRDELTAASRAGGAAADEVASVPLRPNPELEIIDVEQLPPDWPRRYVPIIGRLAAGWGLDTTEAEEFPPGVADHYLRCSDPPARAIALRIEGTSMRPNYEHGDFVIVDPDVRVRSGVCAVLIDRDGQIDPRVKRLTVRGRTATLSSLSPAHKPITVPAAKVRAYAIWRHVPALVRASS